MDYNEYEEAVTALRRHARRRVKAPAMLILIPTVLGMAGAGFFTLSIFFSLTGPEPDGSLAYTRFGWVIPLAVFLWCLVIGYGAYEMDKLGNYRMAKIASVLALIPFPVPLYLLWFIGGLLGLSALNTPAVRAAFAAGNEGARDAYLATRRRPGPPPLPHERGEEEKTFDAEGDQPREE